MDAASLSALAALSGSAVGGLTSFLATWLSQTAQVRAQVLLHDKGRRQELYREFVDEASAIYIDGLTRETPDLGRAIRLYALVSRMRILSTPAVIAEADRAARLVVQAYAEPNKSFDELRAMMARHALDPLRGFAEACRSELESRSAA